MAVAYLSDGATSLAAANWSDATGFAATATLVINVGSASIQAGLDQTGSSISYLDILQGFSGTIGGTGGSLKCDVDGTAESAATVLSRLRYWASGGALYFGAAGNNTLCHFFQQGGSGRSYLTEGIFNTLHVESGELNFSAAATFGASYTNVFTGGRVFVDTHASNTWTTCDCIGATVTLKRGGTTLNIYAGSVTLDCGSTAITTINLLGGTLRLLNCGTVTTFNAKGGTLDLTNLGRPVTFTTMSRAPSCTVTPPAHPMLTVTTTNPIGSGSK